MTGLVSCISDLKDGTLGNLLLDRQVVLIVHRSFHGRSKRRGGKSRPWFQYCVSIGKGWIGGGIFPEERRVNESERVGPWKNLVMVNASSDSHNCFSTAIRLPG